MKLAVEATVFLIVSIVVVAALFPVRPSSAPRPKPLTEFQVASYDHNVSAAAASLLKVRETILKAQALSADSRLERLYNETLEYDDAIGAWSESHTQATYDRFIKAKAQFDEHSQRILLGGNQ